MSPLDRQRLRLRQLRRSAPTVEDLESRHLLTATSVTHPTGHEVHAEVTASQTAARTSRKIETAATTTDVKKSVKIDKAEATKSTKTRKIEATKSVKTEAKSKTVVTTTKTRSFTIKNNLFKLSAVQGGATIVKNGLASPTTSTFQPTQVNYSPVKGAYSPGQLETAYGVNLLGSSNEGQGVTIGIVDVFYDPNIISDANAYSSYYNLPQFNTGSGPTLTEIKDTNSGNSVPNSPRSGQSDTSLETSLDVEMVHAMAPKANIVLITTPSGGNNGTEDQEFADFMEGVQDAAKMTGVVGVSLSYGDTEGNVGSSAVVSLNNQYLATGAAANVAVTVSTGDSSSPGYPATSPNVVAVGATSLFVSSAQGRYFYETAWGGLSGDGAGGGGPSDNFAAPTFQSGNGVTLSSNRTIPDISMVGDPVTGVSVYDTWDDGGGSPWNEVGGTSAAAPLAQGVIALAQQERIAAGLPILNSVEIDTAFYEAYNSPAYLTYFHDIKIGNNSDPSAGITGYNTTTGYDEATGIGSPIANTLVPYLAKYVIGT